MADTTKTKVLNIETKGAEKNVKTLKQQIKELKDQMAQLEKGTEAYDKAAVQLADMMQKQTEITEAAKYANKDFGASLSTMTTVAQGVVGAISAVNGVMNLMGIEGEEAEKAMLKVQSLMAIIQGMGAIDSGIKGIKGLGLAFKNLASSIGISTKALGIWGIAIAAVSTAVIALVDHFRKLKEEAKVTLTELDEKMISANASAQEAVGTYMLLRNSFVDAKEKGKNLTKWVKDHTNELKALNMQNMTMEQYEDAFINRTDEYITALTNRYKAEWKLKAVQDKYIENLKEISRWRDLANKIGDYQNHWDDEYTIDGITRTVQEWQKSGMAAFIGNQHLDKDINEIVEAVDEADKKLKEFGATAGDTGDKTKKSIKELIRLFTELRNKVIDLDLSFDSIASTNDTMLKNEELFVSKFKAIIEKSGIGVSRQKEFIDIINKFNKPPIPDDFMSYNLPIEVIFKEEDLNTLNQKLEEARIKLGELVNSPNASEYEEQKEIVDELEKQVNLRVEIYKAYKDFLKSYEEEGRNIRSYTEKEKDYQNLLETTITYYSELRANNPFAETNRTIAESEYAIDKLTKSLDDYDEELTKLKNEPITQDSFNRQLELLKARKDAETEIFNLQTTLENAYYEQRRIDVNAILEEEQKAAEEQNQQNGKRENDWGISGGTYNTQLQALQVQLQMLKNQKSAVADYYGREIDDLKKHFKEMMDAEVEGSEEYLALKDELSQKEIEFEIEKNAVIEELDKQRAEKQVEIDQESSRRRLKIAQSYVSAYQTISSQTLNILGTVMEGYDENSKQYKDLKYTQGVIDTISGTLAGFMSGVDSGLPAPYNLILAAATAATVFATGLIQLDNLKKEKLANASQPNTNSVNFGAYDTLTYAQNNEILGNITDSRVYVVESDITNTQNRVAVAESNATF